MVLVYYRESYGSLGVEFAFSIWLSLTGFVVLIGDRHNAERRRNLPRN